MKRASLTSLQQSLVLASMRAPRSGAYVIQEVCETTELLDIDRLQHAWRNMAARHEALRTSVETDSRGNLWQQVNETSQIPWQELAWNGVPTKEAPSKLDGWLRTDRELGFDFRSGVPARVTLIRWADSCTLVWTIHHVLVDARSYLIVWREWLALYEALSRGQDLSLPEAGSFSDHLGWLQAQDWKAAQGYWQHNLEGLQETTGYVVDRIPRPSSGGDELTGHERLFLPKDLTHALEGFAQQHGITVNTLVLAAWSLLLSRYSGRREVVFGVTRACRGTSTPNAASTVGPFVNTLPFRTPVPLDASLLSWLAEIRARWTALRDYEHAPLDKIRQWSGLPPGQPLFDTVLHFEREPVGEAMRKLGGAWADRKVTRVQRTDIALTLAVYGSPVLTLNLVYDARWFGRQTVLAMTGHVKTLLESFLALPGSRLSALKMLTPGEERQRPRSTCTPVEFEGCAHGLFERQARRTPEKTALDSPGGPVSYRNLNEQANRLARILQQRGVRPEERVAVLLSPSPEAIIAILAVLKAGGVFVPLEPGQPPERLAQMLECAGPKLVISQDANLVSGASEVACWEQLQDEMASQPSTDPPQLAGPENAAYAIFTSGSTGKPKGVVVTHRSLVNYLLAARQIFGFSEADRRLQFASVGADLFVAEVFNSLSWGAALVFGLSRQGTSAGDFLRFLHQARITITGIPSTWWAELVAALSDGRYTLPASLRALVAGMERVDPVVFQAWKRLAGTNVRWFNAYGPTETTCAATVYEAGTSAWEGESAMPIGVPVANAVAYVLDEGMAPLPVGVAGELFIAGVGVARGYLNSPELTAERFLPDPFDGNGRMYRTGDLAYFLPDGNLVFVGRKDRQVKIRGYRIELEEIEAALARHPAVQQCAVLVESQGRKARLVAYLTARGAAPGKDDLLAHLSRYLPEHMLPTAFAALPEMPLTPSGKLDRQALAGCLADGPDSEQPFSEPVGPIETRLAAMWGELFGIPRVGSGDNFFELGGDSLTATRLITWIHQEFEKELDLAVLLRAPTISRLAVTIAQAETVPQEAEAVVIPIQPQGDGLPLFMIDPGFEGARLARHLGPNRPLIGVPIPRSAVPTVVRSIDQLAAECARAVRAFRPQGPYALAGWCAAGVIALEVARQLEREGSEIAFVAMIDVRNLFPPPLSAPHLALVHLWRRVRRLSYAVRRSPGGQWNRIRSSLVSNTRPELPETAQALLRHRPLPWSGRMLHIWASDGPHGRYLDASFVWRHLAPAGFVFHEVPGDHLTILQEPRVGQVANLLANELDRAQGDGRASSYIAPALVAGPAMATEHAPESRK